jgi:hypothetical protein
MLKLKELFVQFMKMSPGKQQLALYLLFLGLGLLLIIAFILWGAFAFILLLVLAILIFLFMTLALPCIMLVLFSDKATRHLRTLLLIFKKQRTRRK